MKLDSASLVNAINLCNKVVEGETINLECSSKGILFSKISSSNKVSYWLDTKADDCEFTVNINLLLGILRGSKEINLKFDSKRHTLNFESGRKKGNISTLLFKPIKVLTDKKAEDFDFNDEVKDVLLSLLSKVCISPTPFLPEAETSLEIQVRSTGKKLMLLCADRFHSAYCEKPLKSQAFELNLPVSYTNYLSLFEDKFKLSKDENCIYLYNKHLKICLPQTVNYSPVTLDKYATVEQQFGKPLAELTKFNLAEFSDALDSASVVKTNMTDIYLKADKSSFSVECKSEVGNVVADLDYKVKFKQSMSLILQQSNILDVCSLMSKTCTFKLYDSFMIFEDLDTKSNTKTVFMCAVGYKN